MAGRCAGESRCEGIPRLPLHGESFRSEQSREENSQYDNSQYNFMGLPIAPEEVAAALVQAVDRVVDALNTVREDQITDRVEGCLRDLSDTMERIAMQLPTKPEECKLVAELLAAQSRLQPGEAPAVSKEAALAGLCTAAAMLMDVRAAITGVSKDEVAELVEIGLPLARATSVALQAKALRIQKNVCPRSTVLIEDLDDTHDDSGKPAQRLCATLSDTPCRVTLCRGRYLWKPLWPRLKSTVCPQILEWASAPCFPAVARQNPIQTTALAVVFGPAAVWTTVLVAPPVLFADCCMQRIYQWTGPEEVDKVIGGVAQTSKFGYLSGRILVRQSLRVAQTQARRFLGGRTPTEAGVDILKECWRDPVGSVQTSVSHARWASGRVFLGIQHLHTQVRATSTTCS